MSPLQALAALCVFAALLTAQSRPIIVDTDAGSDDIMAVSLLLSQPRIRIDAITVVNGFAHVDAGARSMGRLLDLAGRHEVPVFAGRDHPLRGNHEFPAEWRKISNDFPILSIVPPRPPEHRRAADYLVERLRNARAPVRILALGPMTNLAEALERDPSVARHISELVIMGGAVGAPGNAPNKTAEWNMYIDPFAAQIVVRSGVPIRLIPLDATRRVPIGPDFVSDLQASVRSPLGHIVTQVLEIDRDMIADGSFYAWDPLAAAALIDPNIVVAHPMHVEVKDDGRTVVSLGAFNAKVATDARAWAFRTLFIESFSDPRAKIR